MHGGYGVAARQRGQLFAAIGEERLVGDDEAAGLHLARGREDAHPARLPLLASEDVKLASQGFGGRLQIRRLASAFLGLDGLTSSAKTRACRHEFTQQLEPLAADGRIQ